MHMYAHEFIACKRIFGVFAHHIAIHQFDAPKDAENNWRAALDQMLWQVGTGQVGRPVERNGGRRHNAHLETASVARTIKPGQGNFSEWSRIVPSRA